MRIAFITENSYEGGLDTFIITLLNNWVNDKDEIILMCNHDHPGVKRYETEIKRPVDTLWYNYINLQKLRAAVLKRFGKHEFAGKISYHIIKQFKSLLYPYYIKKLKKVFEAENIDALMVINGGYPASMLCRSANIAFGEKSKGKNIHNFHNLVIPYKKRYSIEKYIDKKVHQYAHAFISVSKTASESIKCREPFLKSDKIGFIYNGIEFRNHHSANSSDLRSELNIPDDHKICTMLGTYEPRKGHEFLLKSFREVVVQEKKTTLLICGYGSETQMEHVRGLISKYQLNTNVVLLPFRRDLANLLSHTDIFLISSQNYESFGLTAVEAMSFYIPIVSTDTGGLKEVIKNGDGGYCFKKNDTRSYSDKILELLRSDSLRAEQGEKGYLRANQLFTAKRMAFEYYNIITS